MANDEITWLAAVRQRGDKAEFGRLVDRYQSPVRNFLLRLTRGDSALADDLAQDTFIAAFRSIRSFRADGAFVGWLMRIAYREFLQDRRRTARTRAREEQAVDIVQPVDDPDLRLTLEREIARLSDGERAAITLCYSLGLTHEEAAGILGIPLGTVKSQVNRGREKLRLALAPILRESVE